VVIQKEVAQKELTKSQTLNIKAVYNTATRQILNLQEGQRVENISTTSKA